MMYSSTLRRVARTYGTGKGHLVLDYVCSEIWPSFFRSRHTWRGLTLQKRLGLDHYHRDRTCHPVMAWPVSMLTLSISPSRYFEKWDPAPVPSWEDTPSTSKSPGFAQPAAMSDADSAALAKGMQDASSVRYGVRGSWRRVGGCAGLETWIME